MVGIDSADIDCEYMDLRVHVSTSAMLHLDEFDMEPDALCGMIHDPINCPKGKRGKPFKRGTIQVCSKRDRHVFSILMCIDYNHRVQKNVCLVTHLKPIA